MLERRKARRMALEVLYQREITGSSLREIIKNRALAGEKPLSEFSLRIIEGVAKHQKHMDEMIEGYADNWALERMPPVDRNIIRMGIYEMIYESDIPFSVSINEAVELAKAYGTEDSSKFVNGILGRIALDLQKSCSGSES
ncbi:MAG: transcription antitermination factor NusB [Actinomycetota bacterium]